MCGVIISHWRIRGKSGRIPAYVSFLVSHTAVVAGAAPGGLESHDLGGDTAADLCASSASRPCPVSHAPESRDAPVCVSPVSDQDSRDQSKGDTCDSPTVDYPN